MSVPVKTESEPIFQTFLAAGFAGFLTWMFWPGEDSPWPVHVLRALFGFVCVVALAHGLIMLIKDYKLRRDLALAERVSTDYGSARQADYDDIKAHKMDAPESGNLLGYMAKDSKALPVFAPPKTPFSLIEMPPGVGKTTCYVIGSILHQALSGRSVIVPDVKLELAPMLAGPLRELGIEVWCVNPTRAYFDICGDVELNPFQAVLDAAYADDDERKDTATCSSDYAELIFPQIPGEKQPYFSNGSRRCLNVGVLSQALMEPAKCTPSDVFALLGNPELFLNRLHHIYHFLETADPDDPLVSYLELEAANLLHRADKSSDNFGAFLEGATQRLLPFNQSGRLGGYGCTAVKNIAEIRKSQVVVFIIAPLSHIRDFSTLISLINHNVIAACKANPAGHPVHIVAEEALNYRFANLASDLEVLRGLKVIADFYIQSFAGLIRQYGREAAQAIESYMDVKIYAGLNSFDRAKFVSEMLSDTTLRKQDYSFDSTSAKKLGVSSRELGRKMMQPNEIMTMARNKAWVFVRGMNPMNLYMARYGQIGPWRDLVDAHPVEGDPLRDDPLFHIAYPKEPKRNKS